MENNLVSRAELVKLRAQWRAEGKKVVFTNGCFDIIHIGHVKILEAAKKLGDILVIGLNSDSSTQSIKGPKRPVIPEEERAQLLLALKSVDFVTLFDENTPHEIIKALVPDILVKGKDYELKDIVGRETVENNGGKVVRVPLIDGKATTHIIARIKERFC